MRILFVLLLLITTSVQSNTLPTKEGNIFWDENLQLSHEGTDFKVGVNNSAGHLGVNGHNILSVLHDNKYLFTPDFPVGIIDSGFYKDHADFHSLMKEVLSTKSGSHGTGVASTFSVSEIHNNLGTHGIVNAKSMILDYSKDERTNLSNYESYSDDYSDVKIITQSQTLAYCTSYRAFDENHECWSGGAEYNQIDMVNHVESSAGLRQHFIDNPDTLFVLAAGNSGVDASWNNGAVHYRYVAAEGTNLETAVFDELDNVIVVAAVGYDGVLHDYSDYGESVDLAVISGVLAASCVDENGSYYYTDNTEDGYGIYRTSSDLGDSISLCNSAGQGNGNNAFNGTSAAAPIAAGMSALLMNMDFAMTPARVKTLLMQYSSKANSRYTGICDENDICTTQILTETGKNEIAIPNLNNAYTQEKAVLMIQARNDALKLEDLTRSVSSTLDCMALWDNGNSTRKLLDPNKSYEAKFYGDRCLYFRGNSYIIDFDLETRQAEYIYYTADNSNKYQEYMTFRHFVNNLKSAKTDETWRNGFGVMLNTDGNVGCTIAENCTDGYITTVQQCENLFEALTGVMPSTMNAVVSYDVQYICEFTNTQDNISWYYDNENGKVGFMTKEDFATLEDVIQTSSDGINVRVITLRRTDIPEPIYGHFNDFNYYGVNSTYGSPLPGISQLMVPKTTNQGDYVFIDKPECMSVICNVTLSFDYHIDQDADFIVTASFDQINSYSLESGGIKTFSETIQVSDFIDLSFDFPRESDDNLFISNFTIDNVNMFSDFVESESHRISQYENLGITYTSYNGISLTNSYIKGVPLPFPTFMQYAMNADLVIDLPQQTYRVYMSYSGDYYGTPFQISDENGNILYADNNVSGIEDANFSIPTGVDKLIISGNGGVIYVDKFNFYY